MTKQPEEKTQKTPKKEVDSGSKSVAEMLRERGHKVVKVPYGDSVKVRIPLSTGIVGSISLKKFRNIAFFSW